jgi:hypothetical protein
MLLRVLENGVLRRIFGRACSTHGAKRNACGILVGEPGGRRPVDLGGRIVLTWILKRYGIRC